MNISLKQKQTLKLSLKLWLPILQAPIQELDTLFKEYSYSNPFVECQSHFESSGSWGGEEDNKRAFIENSSIYQESLYDKIEREIDSELFPTTKSQQVAHEILFFISNEGYFEGDVEKIAIQCNTTKEFVENIRQRFAYIEPYGVGAKDMVESFLFQLNSMNIDSQLDSFMRVIIKNIKNIDKYHTHHLFGEAKELLKRFNSPPAVNYLGDMPYVIPDFFVDIEEDIKIRINNDYYPDIIVAQPFQNGNMEVKEKIKEAKDLVNLLELRKATLYKLVLTIVEKQLNFFLGSELKPLTMAQVAHELGFEESTISRAVSNKYIKCERGTFALRSFFTNAVSKDLSSSEIKNYITSLIENENHAQPLTDQELVDKVMQRYGMNMVRRTITKYRKLLDIPSSKERTRIYKMQGGWCEY